MIILTAVDRSEYAEIVLEHALDAAARAPQADLHFLTVAHRDDEMRPAQAWLEAAVREELDNFGVRDRSCVLHVRRGVPRHAIAACARDLNADLLVVGRFHVPSISEGIDEAVDCSTMIVGPDGIVLAPQCPDCRDVRRASEGEALFCDRHSGNYVPDLAGRIPMPTYSGGIGMW